MYVCVLVVCVGGGCRFGSVRFVGWLFGRLVGPSFGSPTSSTVMCAYSSSTVCRVTCRCAHFHENRSIVRSNCLVKWYRIHAIKTLKNVPLRINRDKTHTHTPRSPRPRPAAAAAPPPPPPPQTPAQPGANLTCGYVQRGNRNVNTTGNQIKPWNQESPILFHGTRKAPSYSMTYHTYLPTSQRRPSSVSLVILWHLLRQQQQAVGAGIILLLPWGLHDGADPPETQHLFV